MYCHWSLITVIIVQISTFLPVFFILYLVNYLNSCEMHTQYLNSSRCVFCGGIIYPFNNIVPQLCKNNKVQGPVAISQYAYKPNSVAYCTMQTAALKHHQQPCKTAFYILQTLSPCFELHILQHDIFKQSKKL